MLYYLRHVSPSPTSWYSLRRRSGLHEADAPPSSLPIAFYLKLFGREISARERVFAGSVMAISLVLSIVGTVWAFLPKSLIGAEPPSPS